MKNDLGNNLFEDDKAMKGQLSLLDRKDEVIAHKDSALKRLNISFNKHIESHEYKKSNLLAYWIKDFSNYHDEEKNFDSTSLKTFKRGDIVKVNLGFNIGNELGGLHYCVVLNKKDNPYSGTLNVIPLSSAKKNKIYNADTCVDLEDELYTLLSKKSQLEYNSLNTALENVKNTINVDELQKISTKALYLDKLNAELDRMKHGSFALIHQITTVSKQRLHKTSILTGIKLSNHSLDLIDEKLKKMFTK